MTTPSHNVKKLVFWLTTSLCLITALLYTFVSARRANSSLGDFASVPNAPSRATSVLSPSDNPTAEGQDSRQEPVGSELPASDSVANQARRQPIQSKARLLAINLRESPDLGKVEFSLLDSLDSTRTTTGLPCERIYFASGKGICLSRETQYFSAQTVATLFDADFRPLSTVRTDGIPSRARISPDGRYAAFTTFVTGHSYSDAQLSTATLLLDVSKGVVIVNLEGFKVLLNGSVMQSPDFNYWGVTFQRDSNFFYATLRTAGVNYLVKGDIGTKTITVVYKGVECPSLSPDETRIAFKKLISRANWRLTVLDLATFKETPLAETRSVDDQAEWLDNNRVLYALVDPAPWMSIMVVNADGTGQPAVFAKGETSPTVVR